MKLTKIKLINWHIFTNETIEIKGNTLITGENASGKSTLMDAIYYVLSGGDQKHFNKAASEGGQRNLETYIRGKIGSETHPYLRPENDVIGYVILEFKDINTKNTLILGSEIEIVSATKPKTHFFVINEYKISDEDFIRNKKVIDFRTLKTTFKTSEYELDELPNSQKERSRKIGRDIFKLQNHKRFFDLLKSAISFKPINEVSTFVNGFLLEEDEINLDSLRGEIRAYQNIHKMVVKEKEKIEVLKDFTPKAEKYLKNVETIEYFNTLKSDAKIEKYKYIMNHNNIAIQRLDDEYQSVLEEGKSESENQSRLKIELHQLNNNEEYKALLNKKKILENDKRELNFFNTKFKEFTKSIYNEQKIVRKLGLTYRLDEDFKAKDFGLLKVHLGNYKKELLSLGMKLRQDVANFEFKKTKNIESIDKKKQELDNLKKGINNYSENVKNLILVAKEAIKKANSSEQHPDVRPLCEHIEVIDEKWSNAVEGYLNTQRFNLIFNPKYYDVVSIAFNKLKRNHQLYGVGIVNIKNIPICKNVDNSMMSKIEVKNIYANIYANYLLGNLVCVDDVLGLKNYKAAVTPEVMIYKNYVLKSCNPKVYAIPYVGKKSRERRMGILENEIQNLLLEKVELEKSLERCSTDLTIISESDVKEVIKTENYWRKIELTNGKINNLINEIKNDEMEKGLLEISGRIDNVKDKLTEIDQKLDVIENKKRVIGSKKGQVKQKIEDTKNNLVIESNVFLKQRKKLSDEKYADFRAKYVLNKRLNEEKIIVDLAKVNNQNNAFQSPLISTMQRFSNTYKASLSPIIENMQDYINTYYDLKNRGVVQYENDAKQAYEAAECSFKEDFISKLHEKISKSQKMMDKLNKNLSLHPFGNDEEKYKFYYSPIKQSEFYNYYRIIMSGKEMNSKDLFTDILDEKDSSFMKDLFGKISMEVDSSTAEAELRRYLDYRNYMSYDIKITNKYGDESFLSKISREKSGGETQTPFYIVIASCFDELMNKDKNKVESTCQVVFDEAFNNMDESRIKSLMEFYKQLNIQLLIIVPSNRISAIAPFMDTWVGIGKVNNHPYVSVINKTA